MPIKDTNKTETPYIVDRDEDVFIGLDIPLHRGNDGNGNFAATSTTLEAVKVNIRDLLQTELGERPMQPNLGIKLKQFLFEPFDENIELSIQNSILDTFSVWLPFITIITLDVKMSETNTLNIFVEFILNKDPNTVESVEVEIGG